MEIRLHFLTYDFLLASCLTTHLVDNRFMDLAVDHVPEAGMARITDYLPSPSDLSLASIGASFFASPLLTFAVDSVSAGIF